MKCQHCGKKLSMVKKLTHGEFCSAAHKKAYHEEQDRLAVARLLENQGQIGAARKKKLNLNEVANAAEQGVRRKSAAQSNSGPVPEAGAPGQASYVAAQIAPRNVDPGICLAETGLVISIAPLHPVNDELTVAPCHLPSVDVPAFPPAACPPKPDVPEGLELLGLAQRTIEITDLDYSAFRAMETFPVANWPTREVPSVLMPDIALSESLAAVAVPLPSDDPLRPVEIEMVFPGSGQVPIPVATPATGATATPTAPEAPAHDSVDWVSFSPLADPQGLTAPLAQPALSVPTLPVWPMRFHYARHSVASPLSLAEPNEMNAGLVELGELERENPSSEAVCALAPHDFDSFPRTKTDLPSVRYYLRGRWLPKGASLRFRMEPFEPELTASQSLAGAEWANLWTPQAIPLPPGAAESQAERNSITANPFSRLLPLAQENSPIPPPLLWVPDSEAFPPKARIASVRRPVKGAAEAANVFDRLVPLPFAGASNPGGAPKMREAVDMVEESPVVLPALKQQVVPARSAYSPFSLMSQLAGNPGAWTWEGLKNHWKTAPSDLRMIALAVPVVIAFLVVPKSPIVDLLFRSRDTQAAATPADKEKENLASGGGGLLTKVLSDDSFSDLKRGIKRRAAIELSDDFRQGLGEWSGPGNWADGWNYDSAGFIRPRKIAIYTPTLSLEDYRFEFLGQIERKALTWVFRAADIKNYYVARLEIVKPGPVPSVELIRWKVVQGKAGPKTAIPLPFAVRMDTIYRVRMDVQGNDFVTMVQGNVVDVFSDKDHPRGGVGFYSDPGDDARLRWVEVSNQYDFLGRLCAFLVPYNVSNANVRSSQ